jgi:hypothetical protein
MGQTVRGVHVSSNGNLRVEFGDGSDIRAAPDPQYEAWNLSLGKLMVFYSDALFIGEAVQGPLGHPV